MGVDMRRAPLLAVDVRAGRIAYVRMLENAVNQREQRRTDGKGRRQGGILTGSFGRKCGKKPISDIFYHKVYQVFW